MLSGMAIKPVVTLPRSATVHEAARLMREKNVGAIVIVNAEHPVGILTDRDIAVSVVAQGMDAATIGVERVMHANPAVIRQNQGIFDVVKLFSEKGVRRLPVVDAKGKLTGIITLDDLLMLFGREMGHVASALSRELGRPKAA